MTLCDGGPLHPASRGPPPPMEEEKGGCGTQTLHRLTSVHPVALEARGIGVGAASLLFNFYNVIPLLVRGIHAACARVRRVGPASAQEQRCPAQL